MGLWAAILVHYLRDIVSIFPIYFALRCIAIGTLCIAIDTFCVAFDVRFSHSRRPLHVVKFLRCDALHLIHTALRSILSALHWITVNWCFLSCLDAPPLKIACMSDSYIAAKIRRVKLDPRYTEVLQLQRLLLPGSEELEMDPASASTDPQVSIS